MPPVLVDLLRVLVRGGYRVELRAVHFDSYTAVVLNDADQPVGTIEYRSPLDEPAVYARGLSYASAFDAQVLPDHAFSLARSVVGEN